MEKKAFTQPETDIILFDADDVRTDVITTSGTGTDLPFVPIG